MGCWGSKSVAADKPPALQGLRDAGTNGAHQGDGMSRAAEGGSSKSPAPPVGAKSPSRPALKEQLPAESPGPPPEQLLPPVATLPSTSPLQKEPGSIDGPLRFTPCASPERSEAPDFPRAPPSPRAACVPGGHHVLVNFRLQLLEAATAGFSDAKMLGQGGFGKVYKGWLKGADLHGARDPDQNVPVAVKRLKPDSYQGQQEWLQEIVLLGDLRHRNLVSLIGYCAEKGEGILVYEYLSKGSLDYHLFPAVVDEDDEGFEPLPWRVRLRVALDAATGLAFLHDRRIIHRDFKVPNILVNDAFDAKLTDFGLAKILGGDFEEAVTTRIMGTMGYLDPKYMETGQLSYKSDVYAFGVFLLELLTGKKAMDDSVTEPPRSLVHWAQPFLAARKPDLAMLVDPHLVGQFSNKAAYKLAIAAKHCVEDDPDLRPPMNDVVETLKPLVHAELDQPLRL